MATAARRAVPIGEAAALRALAAAYDLGSMRAAVRALERAGYRWEPLGAKEGNYGLVNIGSDPGAAFVERITNAIDAVIEDAAQRADPGVVAALESPREAARALFGVAEDRLFDDDAPVQRVVVSIFDGPAASRPVLEVRDDGCGIAPDDAPATILNLAGSNKIAKPYLAGAYGQGGSTTFAFAPEGTVIASATDISDLGVTVVRYRDLDARVNKNGRYDYLVRADGKLGRIARDQEMQRGTVVRHLAYDLHDALAGANGDEPGILPLLRATVFDPVLPLTVVDARGLFARTATYRGARAELQRATAERVEYAQSLTLPIGRQGRDGVVAVRYWVLAEGDTLHADPMHPVAVTNFGQVHGTRDRQFVVEDLQLPYLRKALIVQIELDGMTAAAKRAVLSTTRDRLKRGPRTADLFAAARDALRDDEQLRACNSARRERLVAQRTATDQQRLRRRFATLLEKFRPGAEPAPGRGDDAGAGAVADASRTGAEIDDAAPAAEDAILAAGAVEHPTYVRIVRAAEAPLALTSMRESRVRIETDAPDGYFARHADARIVMLSAPFGAVEVARLSDVRGSRVRAVVRASGSVGEQGTLIVRLTDAFGNVYVDEAPYAVVAPPPPRSAGDDGAARVRVPEIYEVYAPDWPQHGFDQRSVADVAESGDEYTIWVNMDNVHLRRLLAGVPYQETGLARMKTAYLVQSAFYAFLLHEGRERDREIDAPVLERYQARELDRLAQTVISAIASVERLETALFDAGA